jgi:predicted methyltransferase MtxX (methanogen marker protein 4)
MDKSKVKTSTIINSRFNHKETGELKFVKSSSNRFQDFGKEEIVDTTFSLSSTIQMIMLNRVSCDIGGVRS